MANLIIATGMGEPEFSSNKGLIHAFKILGHNVITAGPPYWDRGYDTDILLEDKPHVEYYLYKEILDRAPWQPDLILNIEPHCFLSGPKPPEIISAFYATDQHRAGELYYRIASQGSFNYIFIGQPYFAPLYRDIPKTMVDILPPGFDERRFMRRLNTAPKVDITFIGQTGIAWLEFTEEDEIGRYATKPPANLPTDIRRYAFSGHPGFDYCERAEILIRLCRDFNIRIYDQVWEPLKFQKAIQRGIIGFNRSLLHDISIRAFEVIAGRRMLITDDPNGWFFENYFHCMTYQNYFKPFFPNFNLDYKNIHDRVKLALDNVPVRESIEEHDFNLVWEKHSWRHRAEQLLSIVLN